MKSIISQVLLVLTLISIIIPSQCENDYRKVRINNFISKIIELKNEKSDNRRANGLPRDFDVNCFKNYLKLPQNEKMIINDLEEFVLTYGGIFKCSAGGDKAIDNLLSKVFVEPSMKRHLHCFKWQLKQLEPESKLLQNAIISAVEPDDCKREFSFEDIEAWQNEFEKKLGPLAIFSCGAVTGARDLGKFLSKAVLIEFGESSEDVKKSERQKLGGYLKDITLSTIDCMINRFEKDTKEYLKNDTLNYYLSNALTFSNIYDHEFEKDYNEKLKKLVDNIDIKCTKEKLNLLENGDSTLLSNEASILIASAMSKCIKIDQFDYSNLFLDFVVDMDQRSEKSVYCSKVNLKELEPSSKLAEISEVHREYDRECQFYSHPYIHQYSITLDRLEKSFGGLTGTCFETSKKFEYLISLKTIVLASENDQDLKKQEAKKVFATITEKLEKLADCVLQKVI